MSSKTQGMCRLTLTVRHGTEPVRAFEVDVPVERDAPYGFSIPTMEPIDRAADAARSEMKRAALKFASELVVEGSICDHSCDCSHPDCGFHDDGEVNARRVHQAMIEIDKAARDPRSDLTGDLRGATYASTGGGVMALCFPYGNWEEEVTISEDSATEDGISWCVSSENGGVCFRIHADTRAWLVKDWAHAFTEVIRFPVRNTLPLKNGQTAHITSLEY
jgi:hypothetical protein